MKIFTSKAVVRLPSLAVRAAALVIAGFVAGATPSVAQQTATQDPGPAALAVASAVSYAPIPPDAALDIVPAADTELANDAVDRTIQLLAGLGHANSRDAQYVLNVDAILVRGIGQDAGLPRGQEGSKRGDQYTNADKSPHGEPLTAGNLFNSADGAFLSPAQPRTGGHLLRVSYQAYDRKTGLYVWRGQIERDSIGVGPDASLQQMIPALLEHFGETLAETEVPLN